VSIYIFSSPPQLPISMDRNGNEGEK